MSDSVDFYNGATGDWDVAASWSLPTPPGGQTPYADAAIEAGAAAFTVTVSDTEDAGDVLLNNAAATLDIASGGALLLGGSGSTDAATFEFENGSLNLEGTLGSGVAGAMVLEFKGGVLTADGGTLDNVAVSGTLDLSGPSATLDSEGGLTADAILLTGDGAVLDATQSETLRATAIAFGNADNASQIDVDAVLTLDHTTLTVGASGFASGTIEGSGELVLDASSTLTDANVFTPMPPFFPGSLGIGLAGGFENDGVVNAGYATQIASAVTGTGAMYAGNGSSLLLGFDVGADQRIVLQGSGDGGYFSALVLSAPGVGSTQAVQASITGLASASATIDLTGVPFDSTLTGAVSNGVLTVEDSGTVEAVLNTPDLTDDTIVSFALDDLGGGAVVTASAACFCTGTLIATDRGQTPVEALAIGDRVITAQGAAAAIRWIGRRSYAGRFLIAQPHLLPILIRAGALGGGLPRRDLRVSPIHAMFLDGVLTPAGCLVNGGTIVQDAAGARVDYIHVELASHAIILAEGAPTESFLDDGTRGMFHNAHEFAALYPDATPGLPCAPRVESGPELEAIRMRLAAEILLAA